MSLGSAGASAQTEAQDVDAAALDAVCVAMCALLIVTRTLVPLTEGLQT